MMWVSDIGYLASAFVFAGFCMRTMIPLRVAAICSNITFIAYDALGGIYPVLILHLLLLPMNIWHISQTLRLKKQKKTSAFGGEFLNFLLPHMEIRRHRDGDIISRINERGDRLLVVLKGEVTLEETGITLTQGALFSEAALFSGAIGRTQTARCVGTVESGSITQDEVAQLCIENPEILFHVLSFITNRLIPDLHTPKIREQIHA